MGLVAIVAALAFVAPTAAQVIGEKEETLTSEGDLDVGAVQEETEEAAATEAAEQAQGGPWVPPAPSPEEIDWIKMSSGEWLKGDFQRMVDGTVFFDSDEFDSLEVDWADIAELRSPRKHTYRFPGHRIATGTAVMKEENSSSTRVRASWLPTRPNWSA